MNFQWTMVGGEMAKRLKANTLRKAVGLLLVLAFPLQLAFQNCGGPLTANEFSSVNSSANDETLSVVIAWDKSSSAEAVGYKIYFGTDSANLDQSLRVGDVTSATIEGLPAGAPVYFSAVAVDAEGRESERTPLALAEN